MTISRNLRNVHVDVTTTLDGENINGGKYVSAAKILLTANK